MVATIHRPLNHPKSGVVSSRLFRIDVQADAQSDTPLFSKPVALPLCTPIPRLWGDGQRVAFEVRPFLSCDQGAALHFETVRAKLRTRSTGQISNLTLSVQFWTMPTHPHFKCAAVQCWQSSLTASTHSVLHRQHGLARCCRHPPRAWCPLPSRALCPRSSCMPC